MEANYTREREREEWGEMCIEIFQFNKTTELRYQNKTTKSKGQDVLRKIQHESRET